MSGGAVSNQSIVDFRERNRNRTQTSPRAPAVLDAGDLPQGGANIPDRGFFLGPARDMTRFSPTDIGRGGGGVGSGGRPVRVPGADPFGGGGSTTPLVPGAGSPGRFPRPGPVFGPAPTFDPPPVGPDPERPDEDPLGGEDDEDDPFLGHGGDGGGGGGGGGGAPGPGGGGTGSAPPDRRSLRNLSITQLAPGFRARRSRRSRTAQTLGG